MAHKRDYKPEDILFPNQVITTSDIVPEMKSALLDYAMSVIVDRALPDVRDGLKPVHRRILYTLFEDNLTSDKPFKKSATCVGDVLGKYHPHGDTSVYDAMVRLAQDFSMRYMLVDGHGNFGSVDGDPPAAYRYTEARLSKISNYMLEDIEKDTVDWTPNFDESCKEPKALPSRFPNLLVNGSQGIAVGMTTSIPPHNLRETIDACICVLDNPEATLDDMMQYLKGPDFPTKGIIMGRAGIRAAYATGRGKVVVRARAEFEEYGKDNRTRIIVTELPYMVKKRALIKKIADQVRDKRIDGISDLRDESDRNGMRIVIELKRDANAQVVLNKLYNQTEMQSSFGIIMRALVNDQKQPKILTLKEYFDEYIAFQEQVIRRRTKFLLNKALERAHLLEGLITAQDNIDEVIHIIRHSYDDAKQKLMERFSLDDVQAQAILDMRLKALQGLDHEKLEAEYKELEEKIAYYRSLLSDENMLKGVLKDELTAIRDKFGDDRRTEIVDVSGEVDIEDLIPEDECVFTLTEMGYIKRTPASEYRQQGRNGRGSRGVKTRDEDTVKTLFTCSTHDFIMCFTNQGRAFRIKGYEIPEGSKNAKGTNVVNVLQINQGERITAMIKVPNFGEEDVFLVMQTKKGVIKKTSLDNFKNLRKVGIRAINLGEDDELGWVRLTDGEQTLFIGTKYGRLLYIDEKSVRNMGRTAAGVRAIRLKNDDDCVVGMDVKQDDRPVVTITETGKGKLLEGGRLFDTHGRGTAGQLNMKVDKTGFVISVQSVNPDDDLMLITLNGVIIRIPVDSLSVQGKYATGTKVIRLDEGDKIISAISVAREEAEETEGEDAPEETAEAGDNTSPAETEENS